MFFPCSPAFSGILGVFFGPPFRRAAGPCGLYGRVCGAVGLRFMRHANSVSPLLVGAQGTRKSTFCRSIVPPELRAYYTDSIDFSRKRDAELYLNRFALIN